MCHLGKNLKKTRKLEKIHGTNIFSGKEELCKDHVCLCWAYLRYSKEASVSAASDGNRKRREVWRSGEAHRPALMQMRSTLCCPHSESTNLEVNIDHFLPQFKQSLVPSPGHYWNCWYEQDLGALSQQRQHESAEVVVVWVQPQSALSEVSALPRFSNRYKGSLSCPPHLPWLCIQENSIIAMAEYRKTNGFIIFLQENKTKQNIIKAWFRTPRRRPRLWEPFQGSVKTKLFS